MIYKNRRTHRIRRLENRVAQLERMASAYTIIVATPEDADRFVEERIKPRLMTPQEWASTPIPLPKRVLSNMILFEDGSLRPAHMKTPGDDKLNGWAIPVAVKRLNDYEEMRAKLEDAEERAHKAGYDIERLRAQRIPYVKPWEVVVDRQEWEELNEFFVAYDTFQESGDFKRRHLAWEKIHDRRAQAITPEGGAT